MMLTPILATVEPGDIGAKAAAEQMTRRAKPVRAQLRCRCPALAIF